MAALVGQLKAQARQLKGRALHVLKAAGAFDRVRDSRWRRQRLLILCYHGVSIDDEHEWKPNLYMSPAQFASRLDLLQRDGYSVLPLGEALAALRDGELPPRSVTITVDDGMHDFYVRAFPALAARQMPVTVYLTTYYCEFRRPIYNLMCSYLLWKGRHRQVAMRDIVGQDASFALAEERGRRAAWWLLVETADRDGYSAADKHAVVERLARALAIDYGPLEATGLLHVMPPEEVQELAARGVDFQLHTHRHRTPLDRGLFDAEIEENRDRIARLTHQQPTHFCYPSGRHRPEFKAWLSDARVASATTCDPGLVSARSPHLELPRFVDTSAVSPLVFEGWCTGAAWWLPRKQTYAHG